MEQLQAILGAALYLPRAEAQETGDDDIAAEPISVNGAGERIMVIEDDCDVRDVTTVALVQLGYEVIDGGDGADSVKIGYDLDASIDLLLTDVVLPHGNSGPDLTEALSRKWQQMKVLMMTGYAENDFLRTTDDAPIHPLIQKPFRTSDLSRQIKDVLADR